MSKIDDIKENFNKLHKKDKSYHQIEAEQYLMKMGEDLFVCNSANSEDCYLSGKLELADPDFIEKAAGILEKEVKDVQGYLDRKAEESGDHIPGPRPDSEFKDDGSADHIPD